MVIVDTCVWSLALRRDRPKNDAPVRALAAVIEQGFCTLLGPVRQEILSGVKSPAQFRKLSESLAGFPNVPLESDDFVSAAECFNACRKKGIQGANTDFLICALSLRLGAQILTTDKDFQSFKKVLKIQLLAY